MPGPEFNRFGKAIPAKDGVIPSLGWVRPLSSQNTDYYEPEGGFKASTQRNFKKLLKSRFGLDLEADFRGSYNRILVSNRSVKIRLDDYYKKMEEYEIMPESKQTYELRQKAAEDLEDALFYEMAKGGLAVIAAGEAEPRQIRCDVSADTFVVTEPYSQCAMPAIMSKYQVIEPVMQAVPEAPRAIDEPAPFTEPEPVWPDKPEPVIVNPPGKEPVPPTLMKRPQEPELPQDPMRFGSKEALVEEILKNKIEEAGLKEPAEQLEDPGVFDMEEPKEVEKPNIVIPEPPVRPEACDVEEQMQEILDNEAPQLDRRVLYVMDEPEPFTGKEPVRPVMVKPADIPDPVYLELVDPPKIKYKYEFEEPETPELRIPQIKPPEAPVLDLSDLKEPEYPEDPGNEPPNPGFIARLFSWARPGIRAQIAAHDKWVRDSASLASRREQWEKDHDAYQNKVELREEKYNKEKAEYDRLSTEYREDAAIYQAENNFNLMRYEKKSQAYQEALNKFGGAEYVTAKAMLRESRERGNDRSSDPQLAAEHQKLKEEYEKQLKTAKENLAAEKIREEQEHQKQLEEWEKGNSSIIEENLRRKAEFENKLDEQRGELEKWEENFGDCHGDPEKIAKRYDELESEYQRKLKEYFDDKEHHENRVKEYENAVEACKKKAIEEGMNPEEALELNRQYKADEKLFEAKIDALHKYRADHPEIGDYQDKLVDYQEAKESKEWAEQDYEEYIEKKQEYDAAKKEYDQKKAAFEDLGKAKEQYKADVENLKKEAEEEADHQIQNYDNARKEYDARYEQYKKDDKYWAEQKAIFDENARKMYEPGGLHTRWEERKKAYEDANKTFKAQMAKYDRDKRSFGSRHETWEQKKKDHDAKMESYNRKKAVYDTKMAQIKKIENANRNEEAKARAANLDDPLFKDFVMNTGRYSSRDVWGKQLQDNYSDIIESRKKMDLSREAERIRNTSGVYQKTKKAAPEKVSRAEENSYELRKKEKAHLDKYPSGMKGFVKNLYRAENAAISDAGQVKNLSREAYRDAAVRSMYLSVVRRKADAFAKTYDGREGHTEEINELLDKNYMNSAIGRMKRDKALTNAIDAQFKAGKTTEGRLETLKDGRALNKIYDQVYSPTKKEQTVYDPVLEERRQYKPPQKGNPTA